MDTNKRLIIAFLVVFSILLECSDVRAIRLPVGQPEITADISDVPTNRCNSTAGPPCAPPLPPPTLPPAVIPQPPICTQHGSTQWTVLIASNCHNCQIPSCSSPQSNGATFPYPNHCQYFWRCENGAATICYCPNGTWFDRDLRVCNLCANVKNCPANVN